MTDETIQIRDSRDFWWVCVDICVLRDKDLSPLTKAVYAVLCTFASTTGRTCYPKVSTLAEETGCSVRSTQEALKALEAKDYLRRTERFRGSKQISSEYEMLGHRGAESASPEGGVQQVHPRGAKNDTPELEPREPDKTYTPSECEERPSPEPTSVRPDLERLASRGEPTPEEEIYSPEVLAAPMRETARLLLHETGRHRLTSGEVTAAKVLAARHYPARVQQELRTAVERFRRRGRPLSELTLVYLEESLRHQTSLPGARTTAARRKAGKADPERARWDADVEEWELRQREAVAARFGGEP